MRAKEFSFVAFLEASDSGRQHESGRHVAWNKGRHGDLDARMQEVKLVARMFIES